MFLRGCSDHRDQLSYLFKLKASLALRIESRLEKKFFTGINYISQLSLAVWLGGDRKCSTAVVGLDLVLGLSMARRCLLNRSFKVVSSFLCIVNYSGYIDEVLGPVRMEVGTPAR